jgi:dolichyl-phosphate beta-glucosyltransferase
MLDLTLVIPCYNEANRLPLDQYVDFLSHSNSVKLLLVNDGSSDNTTTVLQKLQKQFPEKIDILELKQNLGKAEAVRKGVQHLSSSQTSKIGYLDADLSTTLEECISLAQKVVPSVPFVFGSRILKIDNQIERKWYRFLIGRIVATVISKMLRIKVYDTQCGCKIFTRETAQSLFQERFLSKWLFDVELFFRMIALVGRPQISQKTKEIPLQRWVDTEDSRVQFSYAFILWLDLIKIYRHYR